MRQEYSFMLQVLDGGDRAVANSGTSEKAHGAQLTARPDCGGGSQHLGLWEPGSEADAEQGAQTPPQVKLILEWS